MKKFSFFSGSPETNVCSVADINCYKNVEDRLSFDKESCDCGDPCEYLHYEISMKKYVMNAAQLQMFVESTKIFPLIRQEAFGFSFFIGSIGGLVGLFAGISIISLVELIYHAFVALKVKVFKTQKLTKIRMVAPINSSEVEISLFNQDHLLYQFLIHFVKFAESSSIHGLNQIMKKTRKPTERMFWIVISLISMIYCMILIFDTTKQAELNPIEFGIDQKIWTLNDASLTKDKR